MVIYFDFVSYASLVLLWENMWSGKCILVVSLVILDITKLLILLTSILLAKS